MATSAQRSRTSDYQSKLSNLQSSLKTATGTKADSIQRAINRTQTALSKIAPVSTVSPSPIASTQSLPAPIKPSVQAAVTSPTRSTANNYSYAPG